MPYLDIIVPHCQEPWSTGEKFFQMLKMQRGIDFDDIRVILVQDGKEGALPGNVFKGYPYRIIQRLISRGGVSAARNKGIEIATAEWLAFCDYDDMYSSVLSMKVALEALKKAEKEGKEYLWDRFMEEGRDPDTGCYMLYRHDWDATFIHGRFVRRMFLNDNGIRFNTALSFGEDSDFNSICQIVAGQSRVGEIREPIYLWCENPDSVTRRVKDKTAFYEKMLKHRIATAEELEKRGIEKEYMGAVVRTVVDCYYEFNSEKATENIMRCLPQFAAFWQRHKAAFRAAPRAMVACIMDTVRANAYKTGACTVEKIALPEWLDEIDRI